MKNNGWKKITALALMAVSLIAFTACGQKAAPAQTPAETAVETPAQTPAEAPTPLEALKAKGTLVLGTSADYPPYEFHAVINGQDEIVGFDIEIGKKIAEELGLELVIKDMKFDGLLAALDQGTIDIIIAGMSPTPERAENVDFSNIYYESTQTIVVKAADKDSYVDAASLAGKRLGVQKGAIQETIAAEQFPDAEAVALGKVTDLIIALTSGRIDAAIIELPVAKSAVKANPELFVSAIDVPEDSKGTAIALKKNSGDYLDAVNAILKKLGEEGLIEKFVAEATELADQQLEQ
ncbi:transporter substrate-binding domain-containing protein [Proteiniclasticum sp. BAD-10]|uniref:Transporter substrate-binding domain-containing protein n=1 Tax=Proteiniclasticum sediminis TaxID=2804028 RepID=A0A941CRJ4_9CLOT|nr:transporter substrate-binding domain-containing protein [Proteiniclasticum sediminis]MBR0576473.1 transporter substrate-binding domain-containing protein [Proteiniclasticum sediminis]